MNNFTYRDGRLFIDNVCAEDIVEKTGTPVYIYSKDMFLDSFNRIRDAFSEIETTICYAVKACSNINILKFMADNGSGFAIVSGGELHRVKEVNSDMSLVVYAGVGKTDREIAEAMDAGIGLFNIESEAELKNMIRIGKKKGVCIKAALRVNPDIDPGTHDFISTGKKETKFGIDLERAVEIFDTYRNNDVVSLSGIHIHIGSGGNSVRPYSDAAKTAAALILRLKKRGHNIDSLDLGGGFGADYTSGYSPDAASYGEAIIPHLKDLAVKLILEPGKSIAANSGILLTEVLYRKTGGNKSFVITDSGMNDLLRPPLYDAFHFIWPVRVADKHLPSGMEKIMNLPDLETVDIVGPVCEGSDFFAKERRIPAVKRGDLLAVFSTGAYGSSMGSNYNSRNLLPEVLVENDSFRIIRHRQTYEDQIGLEIPVERS